MGPKSKKSTAGKTKSGSGGVVDGVSTTEMTREQLEQHANRLRGEMEREREERHFFQLERDKLRTFWEITRQQLLESKAELRNKDRELEEKEESHQDQTKIIKQKLKHLLYEHQVDIFDLRAENVVSLKLAQENFNEQEIALLQDKKKLKEKLFELNKNHDELTRGLKLEFSRKLSEIRKGFEMEKLEIESKYEKLLESQRNELFILHKMEMTEVNERKNKHVKDLIENHEKSFTEIKIYYNDLTLNNLALISSLKDQIKNLKEKEERMEKSLREIKRENQGLREPVKNAKEESIELFKQLANYKKDKKSFANVKKVLASTQKELESLKWEKSCLESAVEKLQKEKNELNDKLITSVLKVQQKSNLKSLLLEKKLKALVELLEQREAQFSQVMTLCQIDPEILSTVNNKVEDLLNKKNAAIQDLEFELAKASKSHDDVLRTYDAILIKYNIPKEEFESMYKKLFSEPVIFDL